MDTKKTRNIVEELLKKMGIAEFTLKVEETEGSAPKFLITTPHSGLLIGKDGEHLEAFVYLIKRLASADAEPGQKPKFFVDVNNYQGESLSRIKNKALVVAERVRSFKTEIELEAMTAYERMTVHSLFTDVPDIKTESRGAGPDRRVVIRYVEGGKSS